MSLNQPLFAGILVLNKELSFSKTQSKDANCNLCDLCNAPGAEQLICKSTSQLCNNQFWQNPQQCISVCQNGQRQCKKFVDSDGDSLTSVIDILPSSLKSAFNFNTLPKIEAYQSTTSLNGQNDLIPSFG